MWQAMAALFPKTASSVTIFGFRVRTASKKIPKMIQPYASGLGIL